MSIRGHERGWYLTRIFDFKSDVQDLIEESDLDDKHVVMTLESMLEDFEEYEKGLKRGYIKIWVEGVDSFIIDSHGFKPRQLNEIARQIQEPEEFEGMESGIYVFKASYCKPEKDHMDRITVPGYWELEQDSYCKLKQKELRKEWDRYKEKEANNE